jgi:hypothetical protein
MAEDPLLTLKHLAKNRPACASLRHPLALEFINTPFETAARTVEVRRITTAGGRWNIPHVGIFLWRLHAAARTRAPLAVTVWRGNPRARALYLALGFTVEESNPAAERLVWHPPARPMVTVS